jgi:hypothetical protein
VDGVDDLIDGDILLPERTIYRVIARTGPMQPEKARQPVD